MGSCSWERRERPTHGLDAGSLTEAELQPVLKSLRGDGISVLVIHHHVTGEQPRMLFLHYWGRGKALDLAAAVRRALDLTA